MQRRVVVTHQFVQQQPGPPLPKEDDGYLRLGLQTPAEVAELSADLARAAQALQCCPQQALRAVTIRCKDAEEQTRELHANWGILAARVPFFRAMAANAWKENQSADLLELSFPDLSAEAVKCLIEFAYCGSTRTARDTEAIANLIAAARYWQLASVEQALCTALVTVLNAQCAMALLGIALQLEADQMLCCLGAHVVRQAQCTLADPSFLSASPEAVIWLLGQPTLVAEEFYVAQRSMAWLMHGLSSSCESEADVCKPSIGTETVLKVADHISWQELSPLQLEQLRQTLLAHDQPQLFASCLEAITEALRHIAELKLPCAAHISAIQPVTRALRLRNPLLQYSPASGFCWEKRIIENTRLPGEAAQMGNSSTQMRGLNLRAPGSRAKVRAVYAAALAYDSRTRE